MASIPLLECVDQELVICAHPEDPECPSQFLGKTGWTFAVRVGDAVIIICRPWETTVPASSVVRGFDPDIDGQNLATLMKEGIFYNDILKPTI